ncbi:MAG: (2Fe-2S)-binding protein [Candidatus Eisenbacteria bacterium]|nr:(2Fe-2S)-binding protein [Candidatus Eisenbacteria bacterium]
MAHAERRKRDASSRPAAGRRAAKAGPPAGRVTSGPATSVSFRLNGVPFEREVPVGWTLLELLREGLGFTGTKCGCGIGECGACTVLLNGEAVNSCLVLASQIDGARVWTIEGVAPAGGRELHPVQRAFVESGAVHCGFCTPGMVMSVLGLLLKNPNPTEAEMRSAIDGNLCRCTGYAQVMDALRRSVSQVSDSDLAKFRS